MNSTEFSKSDRKLYKGQDADDCQGIVLEWE